MKIYFVGYYATDEMVNCKQRAFTESIESGCNVFDYYNRGKQRAVKYDGLRTHLHLYSLRLCDSKKEAEENVREFNQLAQSKGCYAYGAV